MRTAAALAVTLSLAACAPGARSGTSAPKPSPTPRPAPDPDALAIVYGGLAALDTAHRVVFVKRAGGVEVLDLANGKVIETLDVRGALWPAGPFLLATELAFPAVSVAVVDPRATDRIATCTAKLEAPPTAAQAIVDPFGWKGAAFLRWESTPASNPQRGAAMSDAEMQAWQRRFQAAYRCGVLAVRVTDGACRLEPVPPGEVALDTCDTRLLTPHRMFPARVGDLRLRVDVKMERKTGSAQEESVTFVVTGAGEKEAWRTELSRRILLPPPPQVP